MSACIKILKATFTRNRRGIFFTVFAGMFFVVAGFFFVVKAEPYTIKSLPYIDLEQ